MLELSRFDRRRHSTASVREGYREWLPSYETTVENEMDLVLLEALDSVPWTALELRAITISSRWHLHPRPLSWVHSRSWTHSILTGGRTR